LEEGYPQTFREGVHHAAEHWLSFVQQHRADTSAVMEKRGHILRLLAWSFDQPGASGMAAALIRALHHHMLRAAPWSLWEIYLRAALETCRAGQNRLGEVDVLHHYGDFLLRTGRLEEALAVARDAQALLAGLDDARRSCVNHAVFVGIYLNVGRYELASCHAQAGADLARAAEDDVLLADALIGLGRAQLEQGEPEAALEPLRQALELTRRADSLVFRGQGRGLPGPCLRRVGAVARCRRDAPVGPLADASFRRPGRHRGYAEEPGVGAGEWPGKWRRGATFCKRAS